MESDAGEVLAEEIRYATLMRADPGEVYDAIATAEGLDGWFTSGATVDARPGGAIRFRWRDWGPDRITDEDGGAVLEASRPRRFVFQWSPDAPNLTTVEITFEPVAEGTVVRVREYGYRNTPASRRKMLECAGGWGEALTLWKFYVEHGLRY
jgi:uncharacterized protein YndB with AHSA1/START domain